MGLIKHNLRRFTPAPLLSLYHFVLALLGAAVYRFPSRSLIVIGVTGTNGKSSTIEFINSIFEAAGYTTAISSSIRIQIGSHEQQSTGRSMPGRFFIQRFMRQALDAHCSVAIIEMTSEGARQHRHRGIALDCLVFTNLAPEHIESHGSLAAYADAKFQLGLALKRSAKRPRVMVANADDSESARYLALPVEKTIGFTLADTAKWSAAGNGGHFHLDDTDISVHVAGDFNIKNAMAAAEVARAFGIHIADIKRGIEHIVHIPGRVEQLDCGQEFTVVIDYALTPDALEALYKTYGDRKKICVLGSAGGGRDVWKRPVLGVIADTYCESVILTNDIAYDEDPFTIFNDIARDMKRKPEIIADRRLAIRRAIALANAHPIKSDVAVLITGMGIDAEITNANGDIESWSDIDVAREELETLLAKV